MELRIQILSIAVSAALLLVVLEMVRRKAFLERYALLWLLSALVMLGLSIWSGALESLAKLIGIAYPPNALFLVAFGFVLRAAPALLARGVEALGSDEDPRPAAGARGAAAARGERAAPTGLRGVRARLESVASGRASPSQR